MRWNYLERNNRFHLVCLEYFESFKEVITKKEFHNYPHSFALLWNTLSNLLKEISSQNRLQSSSMSDSPSLANLQNKQNRDQQYHAVRCQSNRNSNSNDSGSFKAEGNGKYDFQFEILFKQNDCVIDLHPFISHAQNTSKTFVHTQHFNSTSKRTAKVHTVVMCTAVHIIQCAVRSFIMMWNRMDINEKSRNTQK